VGTADYLHGQPGETRRLRPSYKIRGRVAAYTFLENEAILDSAVLGISMVKKISTYAATKDAGTVQLRAWRDELAVDAGPVLGQATGMARPDRERRAVDATAQSVWTELSRTLNRSVAPLVALDLGSLFFEQRAFCPSASVLKPFMSISE
jgi:hypothetical protein